MELRLSVAQLATMWGVSRSHVYKLVEAGDLGCVRIGKLVRFRPEVLRVLRQAAARDRGL